ncbi:IMPACT family protein [Arenimonas fontis]|uniref:YigZ family protein n=1 Tax=Arenimonas fontis TaxID=2608255 RepID=A0A5B2ZA33_9GAMM|nr:YigZ family protein [Arenimonas fontis]KAA2285518.1 YigZ family protein [Arenimonas fontis]
MSRAQTLAGPAEHLLEVRKSRFLARASPATTPEQALTFLAGVADPQASHNCWAYRVGPHYRFSDDGEPGGSAGRPILAAIEGQGLDQVVVVVTRWFGGVKLGVGGLARAYGAAAAECLRTAPRRDLVDWAEAELACDFAHAGAVYGLLAQLQADKLGEGFDEDGLRLRLRLPVARLDELAAKLRDLSRGSARLHRTDKET